MNRQTERMLSALEAELKSIYERVTRHTAAGLPVATLYRDSRLIVQEIADVKRGAYQPGGARA